MWPFPYGEEVTVIRAARVVDPYSGETERLDWKQATETPYPHCGVEIRTTGDIREPTGDVLRAPLYAGLRVFGPPDMDVNAEDRMRVRGEVWDVDGDVDFPVNPFTGWAPGCTVNLRRVEG